MSDQGPRQFWLRNHEGQLWGPMQASTIHLLVGQDAFPGRLQASVDGVSFQAIGRFEDLREGIDTALWGVDPSEVQAAGGSDDGAAVDPSALAPDAAVVDPSALAPDAAAVDPSVLAPDAAVDPSALAPDAAAVDPSVLAPDAVVDPSVLAPDGAVDPSALAPDAVVDPSVLAPDDDGALDPSALAPEPDPDPTDVLPASGDLSQTSAFRLAYLAFAGKHTCRITFQAAPVTTVCFRRGNPEHVITEDPDLEVGSWLVSQGALQVEQHAQAEQAKANFGGSVTGALFGLGLLDPGSAFPMLAAHAKEAYLQTLSRETGPFEVVDGEPPPPDAIPLGTSGGALLTEAARRLDQAAVERRLGDRLHAPAMRSNASALDPEDLRLGPQETRAFAIIDGVRTPSELGELSGMDPKTVLQVAWLMGECGFVSFGEPQKPAATADAAPTPDAAPTADAAPTPTDWPAEKKRLTALIEKWKKADAFRILEVAHQCSDDDVKQAFTRLAHAYHPDRAAGAPDDVSALYRDAFDRVREAYATLGTQAKRREILNALAEAELAEAAPPAVDEGALEKVRHLVKGKQYDEAAAVLDEALAVNPGFAGAWAWRAWVKVLRAKNPAAVKREAISLIQRALQFDGRSGDAHLIAARIAKRYGDGESAAKHEKKARALGVDDPV